MSERPDLDRILEGYAIGDLEPHAQRVAEDEAAFGVSVVDLYRSYPRNASIIPSFTRRSTAVPSVFRMGPE